MNTSIARPSIRFFAPLLAALAVSGCALEHDAPFDDDAGLEDVSSPVSAGALGFDALAEDSAPAMITNSSCMGPGRPVIAIASDGDCTLPVNDWTMEKLFETGSPEVSALTGVVPSELANFCRYTYVGEFPERYPQAYDDLGTAALNDGDIDMNTVGFDCRAFSGAAEPDTYTADVLDSLHEGFMANIGALDDVELASLTLSPVMLRVLDDAPYEANDQTPQANYFHGLRLDALIDDIACAGQAPCIWESKHNMALPRRANVGEFDEDQALWGNGGVAGYWSDLALAIYAAVGSWREHNAAKTDPYNDHERLVLNLSLGASMQTVELDSAPMQAVIRAFEMAACYGVTVVAASGNRSDDVCDTETGMLAPAVFETMLRPTQAQCQAWGYLPDWDTVAFPVYAPGDQPLVWAVGGVDGLDHLPANGRANSQPRLVATATSGLPSRSVPFDVDIEGMPMTGTSVAAAAASATAKLVWAYDPSLRPDQVMDALYDGGYDLDEPAVGYYAGDDVHRLSVFGALQQAGAPVAGVVGGPDPSGNLDAFAAATQAREDHAESLPNGTFYYSGNPGPDYAPVCEGEMIFIGPGTQPTKPVCAICGIEGNDPDAPANKPHSLHMSMTLEGDGLYDSIEEAKLVIVDSTNQESVITLDETTINAINSQNNPYPVVKMFFAGDPVQATLKFMYKSGDKEQNTLPVVFN